MDAYISAERHKEAVALDEKLKQLDKTIPGMAKPPENSSNGKKNVKSNGSECGSSELRFLRRR